MSKELTPTRSKNALNRSVCSETSNGSGHGTGLAEELDYTLTRIEHRIEVARYQYQCAALLQSAPTSEAPATPSRGTGIGRFLSRSMRRGDKAVISTPDQNTTSDSLASSPSFSPIRPVRKMPTGPVADFIPFPEQEEFIEDLRRVAELCVIGENFVSRMQRKQESAEERAKVRWAAARDALLEDVSESDPAYDETHVEYNEKMQLFDLFFERNALALIVDMLYGESFCVVPELTSTRGADDKNEDEQPNEKETNQPNATSIIPNSNDTTEQQENITLLPPLSIATQALQSISILIQNVSRATSLYVILSNNYMNKLINLPLNLYTTAETRRILSSPESNALPAAFASPQITEIATHFVTFLKSLAMRMNAETLQFFLTYPSVAAASQQGGNDDSHNSDTERYDTDAESMAHHEQSKDDINGYSVEFPLYSRALEFCAAHQDSFVRTTALNICLNTLRLTTIVGQENGMASSAIHLVNRSSPDGVLHNAKPLPYRERLAIARYACIPSRVEHLISPIFTKLAERWSALDEQISDIDSNKHMGYCDSTDEKGLRTEQITMAKEKVRRERLVRSFKEKVADLQDELLLLDDVFKVGLTVLNEQLVETMLATFIYPMLLQPLVIFCQHLNASVDEERFSFSDHPFGGISADLSDVDKSLLAVSSPAKAALYTIASVFKFLSNRALLRLLFTALCHPLSPDSTSAPTVRSKLEVASVDEFGKRGIRLDRSYAVGERINDERTTYDFGTSPLNRRQSKRSVVSHPDDTEACVFVLSPALADVLEFKGDDISLIARTRPNPYRRALLKCLCVPDDMSDIRELAVCVVAAALSTFDGTFGSSLLLGTDLKTLSEDIPADERRLDSLHAHSDDDRGIGGGVEHISRRSLRANSGHHGSSSHITEAISAICNCVIFSTRVAADEWKLGYNNVAAYALLATIERQSTATAAACKLMENRCRQAATALAEMPSSGLTPMGGSSIILPGSPSINALDFEDQMFGSFLNLSFYDSFDLGGTPVLEEFVMPKDMVHTQGNMVEISHQSTLESLRSCVGRFLLKGTGRSGLREFDLEMVEERRESVRAWLKVDAMLALLKTLTGSSTLPVKEAAFPGMVDDRKSLSLYSFVSTSTFNFFCVDSAYENQPPVRSIIDLAGCKTIPCVCEIVGPAAEFFANDDGARIAEGVSWQSLSIVLAPIGQDSRPQLLLSQSLTANLDARDNQGCVISVCPLDRVTVSRDEAIPDDGSAARRVSIHYKWFDQIPPPLFLFDAMPDVEERGSFLLIKPYISRLDVWLENEYMADQAVTVLSRQIFLAKSQRGRRIQAFLDPSTEL